MPNLSDYSTRNVFQDTIAAMLQGGMRSQAKQLLDKKEMWKEQLKQEMAPKEWKPTTKEEYYEAKSIESGLKPPRYQSIGGKILQIPSTGEAPSVIYEDPEKLQASRDALSTTISDADNMLNTIEKIKKGADYFGYFGPVPTAIARPLGIGGDYDERIDWEKNMDYLLSNLWIDKIKTLKAAGRGATGLGSMTEREGTRLENATSALSKAQSKKEALGYLLEIESSLRNIKSKMSKRIMSENGSTSQSKSLFPNQPQNEDLVRQYMEKYPNRTREEIIRAIQRSE